MARSEKQKLKIIYVLKLLMENTDDEHVITTGQIIEKLKNYGIEAERKSIYNDIDSLEEFGLEAEKVSVGNRSGYRLLTRPFELPELKLLVDTVQASKFISEKKRMSLSKSWKALRAIMKSENCSGRFMYMAGSRHQKQAVKDVPAYAKRAEYGVSHDGFTEGFEFKGQVDIDTIGRMISEYVL